MVWKLFQIIEKLQALIEDGAGCAILRIHSDLSHEFIVEMYGHYIAFGSYGEFFVLNEDLLSKFDVLGANDLRCLMAKMDAIMLDNTNINENPSKHKR